MSTLSSVTPELLASVEATLDDSDEASLTASVEPPSVLLALLNLLLNFFNTLSYSPKASSANDTYLPQIHPSLVLYHVTPTLSFLVSSNSYIVPIWTFLFTSKISPASFRVLTLDIVINLPLIFYHLNYYIVLGK